MSSTGSPQDDPRIQNSFTLVQPNSNPNTALNVLWTAQGHLRTNNTFKMILHQFNMPATKSQVCLMSDFAGLSVALPK